MLEYKEMVLKTKIANEDLLGHSKKNMHEIFPSSKPFSRDFYSYKKFNDNNINISKHQEKVDQIMMEKLNTSQSSYIFSSQNPKLSNEPPLSREKQLKIKEKEKKELSAKKKEMGNSFLYGFPDMTFEKGTNLLNLNTPDKILHNNKNDTTLNLLFEDSKLYLKDKSHSPDRNITHKLNSTERPRLPIPNTHTSISPNTNHTPHTNAYQHTSPLRNTNTKNALNINNTNPHLNTFTGMPSFLNTEIYLTHQKYQTQQKELSSSEKDNLEHANFELRKEKTYLMSKIQTMNEEIVHLKTTLQDTISFSNALKQQNHILNSQNHQLKQTVNQINSSQIMNLSQTQPVSIPSLRKQNSNQSFVRG